MSTRCENAGGGRSDPPLLVVFKGVRLQSLEGRVSRVHEPHQVRHKLGAKAKEEEKPNQGASDDGDVPLLQARLGLKFVHHLCNKQGQRGGKAARQ